MKLNNTLKASLLFSLFLLQGGVALTQSIPQKNKKQPNIILIIGDDLTFRDIEPYGNTQVKTPNLAKLAKEGVSFDNMYTATAMCAPTRQQLYSGLYPVRNGAYPNHSQVYPGAKSVAHHLKDLGYNTALIGKKHYGSEKSFPFQFLGGRDHDDGKGIDIDLSLAENFVKSSKDKPYLLVVASNQPHGPLNRGNAAAYPPEKIKVPADLVDNEATRKQLSSYYAEITYLDSLVGACLDIVERSGERENTLVIFTSEQGSGFPFAKWTTYDAGLKTAFIARWPGHIKPNTRNKAMTQYVDVVPTFVDVAGGNSEAINVGRPDALGNTGFDGKSFKSVLFGETDKFRDYVFGVHTTRGIIQGSDAYPIRSVRSTEYLFINNLNSNDEFQNVVTNGTLIGSWTKTGKPSDVKRAEHYSRRAAEELYNVKADPYQLNNLANYASLIGVKQELKNELGNFMKQQGDLGMETEMKAFERQPNKVIQEDENADTGAEKGKKKGILKEN